MLKMSVTTDSNRGIPCSQRPNHGGVELQLPLAATCILNDIISTRSLVAMTWFYQCASHGRLESLPVMVYLKVLIEVLLVVSLTPVTG